MAMGDAGAYFATAHAMRLPAYRYQPLWKHILAIDNNEFDAASSFRSEVLSRASDILEMADGTEALFLSGVSIMVDENKLTPPQTRVQGEAPSSAQPSAQPSASPSARPSTPSSAQPSSAPSHEGQDAGGGPRPKRQRRASSVAATLDEAPNPSTSSAKPSNGRVTPDLIVVVEGETICVGEWKSPGKVLLHKSPDPVDLVTTYRDGNASVREIVKQLYTYMCIKDVKYAILSCYFATFIAYRPVRPAGEATTLYLSRGYKWSDKHPRVTAMGAVMWLLRRAIAASRAVPNESEGVAIVAQGPVEATGGGVSGPAAGGGAGAANVAGTAAAGGSGHVAGAAAAGFGHVVGARRQMASAAERAAAQEVQDAQLCGERGIPHIPWSHLSVRTDMRLGTGEWGEVVQASYRGEEVAVKVRERMRGMLGKRCRVGTMAWQCRQA